MIFLKEKYRIVLDKRNVAAVITIILVILFFLFWDTYYLADNVKLALYQTPALIIVVSIITIDMLPNKVNPFHIDYLLLAKINEKQVNQVFDIFKNTFNYILGEILYYPHEMNLEFEDISIGQLKNINLLIRAQYVLDSGVRTVIINIKIYKLAKNLPLVSFYIPLSSDIKKSIEEMRISKNLDQWKDIIVLANTVEYYLLNHQYDGVIKDEKRRI